MPDLVPRNVGSKAAHRLRVQNEARILAEEKPLSRHDRRLKRRLERRQAGRKQSHA